MSWRRLVGCPLTCLAGDNVNGLRGAAKSGQDFPDFMTSGSEREVETSSEELEEGEIPEERKKKKRRVVQSKRVTRMRKERTRWDGVVSWGVMRCSGCEINAASGCVVDLSGCENPRGVYHTPPRSCRRMWLCDECFACGYKGKFEEESLVCRGWWRNTKKQVQHNDKRTSGVSVENELTGRNTCWIWKRQQSRLPVAPCQHGGKSRRRIRDCPS